MPEDEWIKGAELNARAAIRSYIVLGVCLGMPAILASIAILLRVEGWREWLPVFGGGSLIVATVFLWLGAFRLQISDGMLRYTTLLQSYCINLGDVRKVRHVLEYDPWKDWGEPRDRLEIYTEAGGQTRRVCINLKVFRRKDVLYLLELFRSKLQKRSK